MQDAVSLWMRPTRWPVVAAAASASMLLAAHAFERFAYLAPCPLCLRQREIYWAVIAASLLGLVLARVNRSPRFAQALCVLLGLGFATGAVVAGYHAGAEYGFWPGPASCSAGGGGLAAFEGGGELLGALETRQAMVSCTDVPWSMLGVSMAGWNALVSAALAALSLSAAAPRRLYGSVFAE